MGETALNFGPQWIRELSTGSSSSSTAPAPAIMNIPRYSLAEFRYGREEMLALIPKEVKMAECLKDFPHLMKERFQAPLALTPVSGDEQLTWASCVNSDTVYRGKGPGMGRISRGGSVDRGRGRGRGGYYQRGLMHDELEDSPPFNRPKTVERSLSANEKDHRWDDRDRRYDRTYSGRLGMDDNMMKQDGIQRNEHWRKYDNDDTDWRSTGTRSVEKLAGRGSWRSTTDSSRKDVPEKNPLNRNLPGNARGGSASLKPCSESWKGDGQGRLPEWSVEEENEPDSVGTFDSSGAFMEPKLSENSHPEDIYASDDAEVGSSKDSPEPKKGALKKSPQKLPTNSTVMKPATPSKSKPPLVESKTNSRNLEGEKLVPPEAPKSVSKTPPKAPREKTPPVDSSVIDNLTAVVKQQLGLQSISQVRPESAGKSTKLESGMKNSGSVLSGVGEEDAFAHHKMATENMVAQWTEEEEQKVISQSESSHPLHEKDVKWFYQDPQGEIQGPFTSQEMMEWFSAGYFTKGLMVRRNCDEKFSQLGELIESWGRVPFVPGNNPPPLRHQIAPAPVAPTPPAAATSGQPANKEDLIALQQQLYQQHIMQQQLMLRQAQILAQLQKQDTFTSLTSQQQQAVLMQQFMAQQQMPRPGLNPLPDSSTNVLESAPHTLPAPLLGMTMPPVMKSDMSLWHTAPGTGTGAWPMSLNSNQPPGGSIWDVDISKSSEESEVEKQKKLSEEREKELRLEKEREEQRKQEELRHKQEEQRILQELQKQEEDRKRQEEVQRQQEEQRRLEELKQTEERRRQEEELRKQEELRRQEALRILEEAEKEKLRQLQELMKKEELRKQDELRKVEQKKMEEKRVKEEMQKKVQMEKEREKLLEIERQKEVLRQKELEREEMLLRERERDEMERQRIVELKKSQGPAWGIQSSLSNAQLSLADIQRIQEEKEREEREVKMRQQLQQQQFVKQIQQSKNNLSWAKRANDSLPAVKSLIEIQQEEAERLAQMMRMQKPQAPAPPPPSVNVGVWGNTNHLAKITAPPPTKAPISNNMAGFWDDSISTTQPKKQPVKSNDSAFPALANHPVQQMVSQPAPANSNKSKNVRAKKEEDPVARLFGAHHKPTDEFTKWCTDAISALPSSVDVPTFVAFLKDIESPYEVHDYVKSYLGEGKEPREFAKQFLEKRSQFRNQAKKTPKEENMLWGPAPAITPSVNKQPMAASTNDLDGNSGTKGKAKKKKNRMQKMDSSMLGFTVQSNPDRLNVGEIDHIDGM